MAWASVCCVTPCAFCSVFLNAFFGFNLVKFSQNILPRGGHLSPPCSARSMSVPQPRLLIFPAFDTALTSSSFRSTHWCDSGLFSEARKRCKWPPESDLRGLCWTTRSVHCTRVQQSCESFAVPASVARALVNQTLFHAADVTLALWRLSSRGRVKCRPRASI